MANEFIIKKGFISNDNSQINGDLIVIGTTILNSGGTLFSGLTHGSILFISGETLTEDNSNFFWDDVNNRIGIGTNSPDYDIEINSDTARLKLISTSDFNYVNSIIETQSITANKSTGILMTNAGDNKKFFAGISYNTDYNWGVHFIDSATENDIYQAPSNLFTITKLGNVGIGTFDPTAFLHLTGGTTTNPSLKFGNGSLLSSFEDGAMEYSDDKFYLSNSLSRNELVMINEPETGTTLYYSSAGTWIGSTGGVDLSNYYIKSEVYNTGETYTQVEVQGLIIASSSGVSYTIFDLHTGTTNAHSVGFSNLVDTAHTHLKSEIIDFTESDYVHVTDNESIAGIKTFTNDIIIDGDLSLSGLTIKDNMIIINSGETGSGVTLDESGVEVDRGLYNNTKLYWDESTNTWKVRVPFDTELIINGDFITDDGNWSKGIGWEISGGTANCDGTQGTTTELSQTGITTIGDKYLISFEISNYSLGSIHPILGSATGTCIGTDGVCSEIITAAGSTTFYMQADSSFIGSIDNVSVMRINDLEIATYNSSFIGTQGSILFISGDTLQEDNSNFFYDSTNGRVGLGTISPVSKLHVSGNTYIEGILSVLTITGYYTSTYIDSNIYTQLQANDNFLSANTSYYTELQVNENFLSANTSYYTQGQTDANFLSANTSYYTQVQVDSNFLSANTSENFLSANTSYYTQSQVNENFLSANTSYYTQIQANSNFLSASTSYYTEIQANANFLSANTSYYTQAQIDNKIIESATGVSYDTFVSHTGDTTIHFEKSSILLNNLSDINTGGTLQGYYLSYSAGTWVGVPDSTDLTNYYTKEQVYNTGETNTNYLSANTSYYTQSQANGNFLSANTSYDNYQYFTITTNDDNSFNVETQVNIILSGYNGIITESTDENFTIKINEKTRILIDNSFTGVTILNETITFYSNTGQSDLDLSGIWEIAGTSYTKAQANDNFLSANTSYYTQEQANSNFLSASTSYYTQIQANSNFLSANTSYYTQEQANSNFLSASTSYYTQTQANSNFLSANTSYDNYQYFTIIADDTNQNQVDSQGTLNILGDNGLTTESDSGENFTIKINDATKTLIDNSFTGITIKEEAITFYSNIGQTDLDLSGIWLMLDGGILTGNLTIQANLLTSGLTCNYVEKSSTYTITNSDYTINCTSGTFNTTLPTAIGIKGQIFNIKNMGTGEITVDTTLSQTIDGSSTMGVRQYDNLTVQSTNENWIIL